MRGKKFTDINSGKIIQVKDIFEDIVILEDNSKVRLNRLLDKNYYDEFIDPRTFFKNESLLNTFAEKIKQIPDNVVKQIGNEERVFEKDEFDVNNISRNQFQNFDEPAILPADPELEKEELMRKYGIINNPITEAQKQLEKFKSLLEEPQTEENEVVQYNIDREERNDDWIDESEDEEYIEPIVEKKKESTKKEEIKKVVETVQDPIVQMFKNVKRKTPFKLTLDFENLIPRADFIEMMEDSYNTSIIEFLADEFTNEIISDPQKIKDLITSEIKKIVYGEEKNSEVKNVEKKDEKKTEEHPKTKRVGRKKRELADDRTTIN